MSVKRPTSESLPAFVMKCTTGGCKRGRQQTNTIMARGQNASTGRTARSEGLPSIGQTMSQLDAERYLIKNANRGYPADKNDLLAQYGEEAYEMRANGMRAPAYGKWLEQQVGRGVRAKERASKEEKLKSTKEGRVIETSFLLASELYKESTDAVSVARNKLSVLVKEETGMNLDAYIREKRFAGEKPPVVDAQLQRKYPTEHAELERVTKIAQERFDEYQKRSNARAEFLAP